MALFEQFIFDLKQLGVVDVLLPFLLVFTVVYGVLQKIKIFGDESKRFNVVIALVMGFGVVIPHVLNPGRRSVVDIINAALPEISLIAIAIVMFLLIVGVFGNDIEFAGAGITGWAVMLSLVAVILIFGNAAGIFQMPQLLYFLEDPQIQSLIVVILVFGIIIWFITAEPEKDDETEFLEGFSDIVQE